MSETLNGGCFCGKIRYRLKAAPMFVVSTLLPALSASTVEYAAATVTGPKAKSPLIP